MVSRPAYKFKCEVTGCSFGTNSVRSYRGHKDAEHSRFARRLFGSGTDDRQPDEATQLAGVSDHGHAPGSADSVDPSQPSLWSTPRAERERFQELALQIVTSQLADAEEKFKLLPGSRFYQEKADFYRQLSRTGYLAQVRSQDMCESSRVL